MVANVTAAEGSATGAAGIGPIPAGPTNAAGAARPAGAASATGSPDSAAANTNSIATAGAEHAFSAMDLAVGSAVILGGVAAVASGNSSSLGTLPSTSPVQPGAQGNQNTPSVIAQNGEAATTLQHDNIRRDDSNGTVNGAGDPDYTGAGSTGNSAAGTDAPTSPASTDTPAAGTETPPASTGTLPANAETPPATQPPPRPRRPRPSPAPPTPPPRSAPPLPMTSSPRWTAACSPVRIRSTCRPTSVSTASPVQTVPRAMQTWSCARPMERGRTARAGGSGNCAGRSGPSGLERALVARRHADVHPTGRRSPALQQYRSADAGDSRGPHTARLLRNLTDHAGPARWSGYPAAGAGRHG